jgi:hypothetical protein
MSEKGDENNILVARLLGHMHEYIVRDDHNFNLTPGMAYCPGCEAIVKYSGDYSRFTGNGCGFPNYETVKKEEACDKCNSKKFIKISAYDMSKFFEKFNGSAAEILIMAIKNGLKEMNFPTLYCEALPRDVKRWKRLSKKEKIKQINSLRNIQLELVKVEKKKEILEGLLK